MHELSIAQNIVEIIHQYVPPDDRERVRSVRTIVGEQSGVSADSLSFSFQAITTSTELQGSQLVVESVPFTIRCTQCAAESHSETGSIQCPRCGALDSEITEGTELRVREIELADGLKEAR